MASQPACCGFLPNEAPGTRLIRSRYKSVRIDAVHYCEIEEVYAEQRRRKSRSGEDFDAPTARLLQLERAVRDNHHLGSRVRFLKLPYMTRESCKADLARTVSVCPNLEYVDLPDGFYNGDVTCLTLRQELQARCGHIRRMKYNEGSERELESLLQGYWQELRVVEINRVRMEPTILRRVFGILPWLSEVTFSDVQWLNDSVLQPAPGLPDFPPLETLNLREINDVTVNGLAQYLSSPVNMQALRKLVIKDCPGLPVPSLHILLQAARSLRNLDYTATVSASLPMDPLPPMASRSLHTLHFEINSNSSHQMYPPADSYYQYLTTSLMSSALPSLRKLYVRDPNFPESLTLAPPIRPFADSPQHTPRGFNQPLEVYSKGMDELDWIFTSIIPADGHTGRRGSMSGGRPLSSYSAHKGLGPQWGGDARKSIVVPNGFGGFLAVPSDNERPRSAGNFGPASSNHRHTNSLGGVHASFMHHGNNRSSRADLWR
jgi:hypothetical protein